MGQAILPPHTFQETHTRNATHALNKALLLTLPLQRVAEGKANPLSWCIFLVFALALALAKYVRIKKLVTLQALSTTNVSLRNV